MFVLFIRAKGIKRTYTENADKRAKDIGLFKVNVYELIRLLFNVFNQFYIIIVTDWLPCFFILLFFDLFDNTINIIFKISKFRNIFQMVLLP